PRGGLDRRDDLPRHAQLREAPERRLLVGPEVPNRLVEADQALLDEIFGIAAGEKIRAGLEPHEAGVSADQDVERTTVAVPGAQHELKVFQLPLGLLGG